MSSNMASTSAEYEAAAQKFRDLNSNNTASALELNKTAMEKSLAAQQAGNAAALREQQKRQKEIEKSDLYGDSFKKASKTAEAQAKAQGALAQSNARRAGMSKAAAAEMGANAATQGMAGAMGQQQQTALNVENQRQNMLNSSASNIANLYQQQGVNTGNTMMAGAGNQTNVLNNQTANAGAMAQMEQAEGQNRWNRSWNNMGRSIGMVGSFLNTLTSDENLKDYKKNNTEPEDKWANIDKILDNHKKRDYKSLVIMTKENR